MLPLMLTVLNRDYSTPLLKSLLRTASIRGNIPIRELKALSLPCCQSPVAVVTCLGFRVYGLAAEKFRSIPRRVLCRRKWEGHRGTCRHSFWGTDIVKQPWKLLGLSFAFRANQHYALRILSPTGANATCPCSQSAYHTRKPETSSLGTPALMTIKTGTTRLHSSLQASFLDATFIVPTSRSLSRKP